jgi:hypothetical protein
MKKYLIILLVTIASCKKENGGNTVTDTANYPILIVGGWVITAKTVSPAYDYNNDGVAETDIYSVMSNCSKDYKINLEVNGVGNVKTDCLMAFKNIKWSLIDNGTTFKWVYDLSGVTGGVEKIQSLSQTVLVTTYVETPTGGGSYNITNTYTKR